MSVHRPSVTTEGIANAGAKLAGGLSVLVIFLLVLGGGVYRTDCTASNGQVTSLWLPQGDIPYLWSPSDSHCKAHTLMRYVLGKVGVMSAISAPDQAYTAALVKQVGTGSVAEQQVPTTLESLNKNFSGFSDASTTQATVYLAQGQLNKLSQNDLVRLADVSRTAATRIGPARAKLNRLAATISVTAIDASSFSKLPDDSKTLIADWNGYLTATSGGLRSLSQALSGMKSFYNEFQQLVRAAYNTTQLRSTAQFDKVRTAVVKDMVARSARIQAAQQSFSARRPVERKLVSFVNGSQDAQAIVTRVNHDHPGGFLAHEFKHNS